MEMIGKKVIAQQCKDIAWPPFALKSLGMLMMGLGKETLAMPIGLILLLVSWYWLDFRYRRSLGAL